MTEIISYIKKCVFTTAAISLLIEAGFPQTVIAHELIPALPVESVAAQDVKLDVADLAPAKVVLAVTTAYSSTPDQTDDTPFITANGTRVRDGIVAANWLPFGAQVRIPEYFGDKIFEVTDRMHRRHSERLDIWMPTREQALKWGIRTVRVEVVEN